MSPPISWRALLDEISRLLTSQLAMADDSALATVMAVQHALLPSRGRVLPVEIELAHDYAAWHRAMMQAKHGGHYDDWPDLVPPLRSYGPATFEVSDPIGAVQQVIGHPMEWASYGLNWEYLSPVSRPIVMGLRMPEFFESAADLVGTA